jgi:hypothetical protein
MQYKEKIDKWINKQINTFTTSVMTLFRTIWSVIPYNNIMIKRIRG